jgi:hypothetical protein
MSLLQFSNIESKKRYFHSDSLDYHSEGLWNHVHFNAGMGLGHIKIFFSRTIGPILTRLGTNHPWGEGILNCSNEGDCLSSRGDNSKRVKIH